MVDDESDITELVAHHVAGAGFTVDVAGTGEEALERIAANTPDLVLLDVMLPDRSGTEVLKHMRQAAETASTPVILLTARGDEMDRVLGFELGADDYVVKPFSARELVLRVKALLRRADPPSDPEEAVLTRGLLQMDTGRHRVLAEGQEVDLTPLEFRILACLLANPGRVLSREKILEKVWGESVFVTDRTVDTHIKRLRAKLGEKAADAIETIRGVGYRLKG